MAHTARALAIAIGLMVLVVLVPGTADAATVGGEVSTGDLPTSSEPVHFADIVFSIPDAGIADTTREGADVCDKFPELCRPTENGPFETPDASCSVDGSMAMWGRRTDDGTPYGNGRVFGTAECEGDIDHISVDVTVDKKTSYTTATYAHDYSACYGTSDCSIPVDAADDFSCGNCRAEWIVTWVFEFEAGGGGWTKWDHNHCDRNSSYPWILNCVYVASATVR